MERNSREQWGTKLRDVFLSISSSHLFLTVYNTNYSENKLPTVKLLAFLFLFYCSSVFML